MLEVSAGGARERKGPHRHARQMLTLAEMRFHRQPGLLAVSATVTLRVWGAYDTALGGVGTGRRCTWCCPNGNAIGRGGGQAHNSPAYGIA